MNCKWIKDEVIQYDKWNQENIDRLPVLIRIEYKRLFDLMRNGNIFGVFLQVKDVYELLVKVPTLVSVAMEYNAGINDENGKWLFKFFEKDLAFGDWATISMEYTKICSDTCLQDTLENLKKFISKSEIIKWRNDWIGHGALAQDDNEEFVLLLKEKIMMLYQFVVDNIEKLEKFELYISNTEWKCRYEEKEINMSPWIINVNGNTYLYDSYRVNKKKVAYLDYENGGKIEETNKVCNDLLDVLFAQNNVRRFVQVDDNELIMVSEESIIKELNKVQKYIRPEYLCKYLEEFTKLDKGIMLLQMREGFGKTSFINALDYSGINRIKISDCMIRAYYINDSYASNVDYFISNMYDLFRMDRDGKILFRGNLPTLSKKEEKPSLQLCNLLDFYRRKGNHSKLLFVLDGIDEIVKCGDVSILDFIPNESEIPNGVFILCTCRCNEELINIPELYRRIQGINFTKEVSINKDSLEYKDLLIKYIKKVLTNPRDTDCENIINVANYKFDDVDKICQRASDIGVQDIASIEMVNWDIEYLKKMFGNKFFLQITLYMAYLKVINEPLTINELSNLCYGRNTSLQDVYLLWYMQDLIRIDRNSKGNKISIKNEEVRAYFENENKTIIREISNKVLGNFIQEEESDRTSVLVAKHLDNIMDLSNEGISRDTLFIIGDKISRLVNEIDLSKIDNIIDVVSIYDSFLIIINRLGLDKDYELCLSILARQAELYEIYGLLHVSRLKYQECLKLIDKIPNQMIQDAINIKLKYVILLDKMGIAEDCLDILNQLLNAEYIDILSAENKMLSYANRGHIYQRMGQNEKAVLDLNIAIGLLEEQELLKDNIYQASLCYLNRSILSYLVYHDFKQAEKDAKRAISLTNDNDMTNIKVNRARALLNYVFILDKERRGNGNVFNFMNEAIVLLEQICNAGELYEVDVLASAYCNKGLLLEKKGKRQEAVKEYQKAAVLLESFLIQGRCYCLYELYKAYHLLLKQNVECIEKIYKMIMNQVNLEEIEYVTWPLDALLDLFNKQYRVEELLDVTLEWIMCFAQKNVCFKGDDISTLTAVAVNAVEILKEKKEYQKAIDILGAVAKIKEKNDEQDEVYAFIVKETGLCYIKENKYVEGDTYYNKAVCLYEKLYKNHNLENIEEYIILCANKGIVNIAQRKFQDAYDIFYRGMLIINAQLQNGVEVDLQIVNIIAQNLIILIQNRDETGITVN